MDRNLFPLPAVVAKAEDDLDTLAAAAKSELTAETGKARESVEHARKAGEILKRAWNRLAPEHRWNAWLEDSGIDRRRAGERIQIYDNWSSIPPEIGSTGVSEVLEFLRKLPSDKPPTARKYITLGEWEAMSASGRRSAVAEARRADPDARFNPQDNDSIEWALWSWNPVTGCLHQCPYCYARDIAHRFYEQKFEPTFFPGRLRAPHNTPFPEAKATEWMGHKNVFVCSMADLFGRWVPREWIDAVLAECRAAPQWNFLFLTKFPIRLSEFDFPDNAWVGTTVDCQARVANAERAFRKVNAGVKWLSCEPLIEPLRFADIGAFDWVVLGGASASSQTPEWRPPFDWIASIKQAATHAGVKVYMKTNLIERVREYPGLHDEAPAAAPEPLRYLPTVES